MPSIAEQFPWLNRIAVWPGNGWAEIQYDDDLDELIERAKVADKDLLIPFIDDPWIVYAPDFVHDDQLEDWVFTRLIKPLYNARFN